MGWRDEDKCTSKVRSGGRTVRKEEGAEATGVGRDILEMICSHGSKNKSTKNYTMKKSLFQCCPLIT